jgi:dTDP-4-amino-4,6-dideoxygalactose transaminase
MPAERVPFFVPWITDDDKKAVLEALNSRWLTSGPNVARFEKEFSQYVSVKHAVAVSNCTAALHLVMRALNIRPGDEVIIPAFTFAATANSVLFCGARPIFADIQESSFNISPADIQSKITPHTKAIVAVHYAGQPCDMDEIMEIAQDSHVPIIEDCAHSLGATYGDCQTGSMGIAGCFSFYPTKNITTLEGGMITTNDDDVARRAKLSREHCMTKTALDREKLGSWFYDIVDLGYNYRMNEIQAALGISQLKRVEEGKGRRTVLANYYSDKLRKMTGIVLPTVSEGRSHAYHLYVVRVVNEMFGLTRDELYKHLTARGIGLSVHYTPLHLLTYYKQISNSRAGDFPVAERAGTEVLSLPLFPTLAEKRIDYISDSIEKARKS